MCLGVTNLLLFRIFLPKLKENLYYTRQKIRYLRYVFVTWQSCGGVLVLFSVLFSRSYVPFLEHLQSSGRTNLIFWSWIIRLHRCVIRTLCINWLCSFLTFCTIMQYSGSWLLEQPILQDQYRTCSSTLNPLSVLHTD